MDDTKSVRNPLNLCRREQKTRPLIKYYLLFLLFSFVFFFSLRFGLVLQLPIPPGLSVYGEPDEVTSNIYESIDLQREYINPCQSTHTDTVGRAIFFFHFFCALLTACPANEPRALVWRSFFSLALSLFKFPKREKGDGRGGGTVGSLCNTPEMQSDQEQQTVTWLGYILNRERSQLGRQTTIGQPG